MTVFLEDYVALGMSNIIVLNSEWHEERGGYQDEYTTEEIVCMLNGEHCRITIRTKQTFAWNAGKTQNIVKQNIISEKEYNKILLEKGGIEDTKEWREKQKKLRTLYKLLDELDPICRNCGSKMVEREGRYGVFYGCSRYPECNATTKISDSIKEQKKDINSKIEKLK